jgi:hypothetical protein
MSINVTADVPCEKPAGAPEAEIEITPEMIEAGISILLDYDPRYSNEKDIVEKIIRLGEIMGKGIHFISRS